MLRNRNLSKILLLTSIISCFGAFSYLYKVYQVRKEYKIKTVEAYEQGNCKLAVDYSTNVISSWQIFKRIDNYNIIAEQIKTECLAFLETTQEAELKIEDEDYAKALVDYGDFVLNNRESSLVPFVQKSVASMFSRSSPEIVASKQTCSQIYSWRENGTISEPDVILPLFHWHCGQQAYQRVECEPATQHLEKIINLTNFTSYSTDAQKTKQECESFTAKNEKATQLETEKKLDEALLVHNEFLSSFNQGALASFTRKSTELLFAKHGPAKLASSVSCEKTDSFIENNIIPNRDSNLPHFYWSCGQLYATKGEKSAEIDIYIDFLNLYSTNELAFKVNSAILTNSVACNRSEELQNNKIIAEKSNLMPVLYISCGKAYQEVANYPKAIEFFGQVNHYYPSHSLVKKANDSVIDVDKEIKKIQQEILVATNVLENRIIGCTTGNLFLGTFVDLGELFSGKDCMTGKKLGKLGIAMNIIPFVDLFKDSAKATKTINNLRVLRKTIGLGFAVKKYYDVTQTKNLLQDNEDFFALLLDDDTMNMLAINNSSLNTLVLNKIGDPIDLSKQHSEAVKLL